MSRVNLNLIDFEPCGRVPTDWRDLSEIWRVRTEVGEGCEGGGGECLLGVRR